jgi:hypothetical protein
MKCGFGRERAPPRGVKRSVEWTIRDVRVKSHTLAWLFGSPGTVWVKYFVTIISPSAIRGGKRW